MSISKLYKQSFFTNSSWICPDGIKFIILTGCGGGGGGGGGGSSNAPVSDLNPPSPYNPKGGSGGEPAITTYQVVKVNPGTNYSITIGTGGVIGNGGNGFPGPGLSGGKGISSYFDGHEFVGGNGGLGGTIVHDNVLSSDIYLKNYLLITNNGLNSRDNSSGPSPNGRGGGAGGISNNIYSYGGFGGSGASNNISTYNFKALIGGNAGIGGGGGGGGSGIAHSTNTVSETSNLGAAGGAGGLGFIEIAWIQ